jgi:hypothetical protein
MELPIGPVFWSRSRQRDRFLMADVAGTNYEGWLVVQGHVKSTQEISGVY